MSRSIENPYTLQKNSSEYYQTRYLKPNRMSSYGYQFKIAMETEGTTFLNVGSGNDVLNHLLKKNNKVVFDLDIDYYCEPQVCASLPNLPFASNSFDVVMCFQVLEHLPFSYFIFCVKELLRISSKTTVISLPDISLEWTERFKYLIFKRIKHPKEWERYKPKPIDVEHFWEIGSINIMSDDIVALIDPESNFKIIDFRNELNPYHHFFIVNKQLNSGKT